jgi:cell division protein FtsB
MAIKNLLDKKKLLKRLFFFGGLFLCLFFVFGLTKEVVNRRQFDRRIADYEARIERIKNENSTLEEKISFWDKSTELEGSVRMKLGMEKPGERTIILVRNDEKDEVAIKDNQSSVRLSTVDEVNQEDSNPEKWWNYFFHSQVIE